MNIILEFDDTIYRMVERLEDLSWGCHEHCALGTDEMTKICAVLHRKHPNFCVDLAARRNGRGSHHFVEVKP